MKQLKVGSDFSGVGAFDQALKRLGVNYETVFACDMDKYARDTFIYNYGEPKYYPTNVYDREIPSQSLDIYMTSPPCQAFSSAGKRLGKEDKRGILFFNSHELIQVNKPRFFIFENVRGLLSDDGGRTFQEWVNMLGGKSVNGVPVLFPYEESVPYHLYWQVLNAKNHGVPQNRERVFLVGIRDDADNKFQFPREEYLTKRLKDVLETDVDDKYFLSEKIINGFLNHNKRHIEEKGQDGFNWKPKDETQIANCLRANAALCPTDNTIKVKYNIKRLNETLEKHELPNDIRMIDSYNKSIHEDSICISTRVNASACTHLWDTKKVRRLTPRECFRLMDFPDTFTWKVSDSQAYKQAGNSIVVNVLYKILKQLPL
jgi:DNA (cytosine-5)-methyltransferase 1